MLFVFFFLSLHVVFDDDKKMTQYQAFSLFFLAHRCIMSSSEELIELVRKLKRERSFVQAEQKHIREQYTQVGQIHSIEILE